METANTTPAVEYTLLIAGKEGHVTETLELDPTVDRLIELFKSNRMWITINDMMFYPEATFTGSDDDNLLVARDKQRLRDLISSYTQIQVNAPAITPTISAVGELRGGNA